MQVQKVHINGATYYRATYGATPGKWYRFQGLCGDCNQTNLDGLTVVA